MKKLFTIGIISILSLNFLLAQNKRALSIEDLWKMNRISSFNVSPDDKKIVFNVTFYSMDDNKGISDLWIVNTNGTEEKMLKKSPKSIGEPQFIENGKRIFFIRESQGWSCDLNGGREIKYTDFYPGISGVEFSADGKNFIFTSNVYPDCETQECNKEKDSIREKSIVKAEIFTELMYRHWNDWRGPKISHLFLHNFKDKNFIDINLKSKFDVPPIALGSSNDYSFSSDGKEIAFTMNTSDFLATSTDNDVFVISLEAINKGNLSSYVKISSSLGNDNQPIFSPDGKYIAYCSMERAGFEADKQRIMLYNRTLGINVDLTTNFDISAGEIIWSKDSKSIFFTAANQVYNSIFKIDIDTQELTTILEKAVVSSIQLSNDGKKIFFLMQKSTMPYEIFSINTDGTGLKQITNVNRSNLANIEMNEIETFWSDGAENAKVQSILVKPPFFDPNKKYPMMFLIHGGPQGHWNDDFHYRWNLQMFAAKGYVVVAPNPRGSFGYGQKFTDEISKDWGGKVYIDLMNAYDYAIENYSYIDKANTFAAGASYGGYMINWIAGHTDRFNALVCHAGVFNLESMYGTTEELWFPEWENGGTPWENRELYQKWSPHMFVQNFKTPMLVIHGAYDFRVPYSQAMELFTSLQRMGVKSKFLYFPDETHFVVKPQNARLWWNTVYDWLEENKK